MAKVNKLDTWLNKNEDRKGKRNRPKKSNVTDNESAKMKSSRGVIQGYNGLAVVDDKNQLIVHAEANGQTAEGELLGSCIEGTKDNIEKATGKNEPLKGCCVTADTGFHTIDNCALLVSEEIDGYVPDCNFRKRDPRFTSALRHKESAKKRALRYEQSDFTYDAKTNTYICPMGNKLTYRHYVKNHNGMYRGKRYRADISDCSSCQSRSRCLKGKHVHARQLMIVEGTSSSDADAVIAMKNKVGTPEGRNIYSKRMGIVEPVFGNIVVCKGLDRFTLRGKIKVNIQWKLYSLVHNIGKIWRCNKLLPV